MVCFVLDCTLTIVACSFFYYYYLFIYCCITIMPVEVNYYTLSSSQSNFKIAISIYIPYNLNKFPQIVGIFGFVTQVW